jgi:hypothetical protein
MTQVRRLIGVYDADGGLRGEIAYLAGKVAVNAKTYQWSGVLQAPLRGTAQVPAQAVAQLLGTMCGAPVNPGDNLGSITVTVKSS